MTMYNREIVNICGKYGVVKADSRETVILPEYDQIEESSYDSYRVCRSNKYGLMSDSGETIIPCEYDRICFPSLWAIRIVYKGNLQGAYSCKGELIVPVVYDDVRVYSSGIVVKRGNEYGLYNHDGLILCEAKYDDISSYENAGAIVISSNGLFGLLSDKGEGEILPCSYDKVVYDRESRFFIMSNGRIGLYSSSIREFLTPIMFKTLKCIWSNDYVGFGHVFENDYVVLIDKAFSIIKTKYTDISIMNKHYIATCAGQKSFLDAKFQECCPYYYDEILPLGDTYYVVEKDGNVGIVRASDCECIIDCIYPRNENQRLFRQTSEDYFIVCKNGLFAYFRNDGQQLTDFVYDYAGPFVLGKAEVRRDYGNIVGWIDINGNESLKQPRHSRSQNTCDTNPDWDEITRDLVDIGLRDAFGLSSEDEVPTDWND